MKDSKIGGAYDKYGREVKCRLGFDEESRKKSITLKTYVWMRAVCNTKMVLEET
jgi:hypothetical protein